MGVSDTVVRLIRTWVPVGVGWLISIIPGVEGVIDQGALTALVIAGWYGVAAWLEKVNPVFGWLLGYPKDRAYG